MKEGRYFPYIYIDNLIWNCFSNQSVNPKELKPNYFHWVFKKVNFEMFTQKGCID